MVPLGAGTGKVTISVNNGAAIQGPVFTYQLSAVVTTFAGSGNAGSADGIGTAASFYAPWGLAFDASGNLYVSDAVSNLLRKITPDGTVSFVAGNSTGTGGDGKGADASFVYPTSLATDHLGNVYVADVSSIRKVTPDGTVTTVPGSQYNNGSTTDFTGIVLDAAGNIYASDLAHNIILEIKPDGTSGVFAGSGAKSSTDGKGTAASFNQPVGLAIDASGNIFVADQGSDEIRKVAPDGTVITIAGNGSKGAVNATGTNASFFNPAGVAVDATGNLYIGDSGNYLIRKITPDGSASTLAGSGTAGALDGLGTAASFYGPQGLAIDASGNIFVADGRVIRKITFQ